jgi:hypothetical protein
VDPRASLDDVKKRIFLPYRESNSEPSVVQSVDSHYTEYAISLLGPYIFKIIDHSWDQIGDLSNSVLTGKSDFQSRKTGVGPTLNILCNTYQIYLG